MCVNEDAPWVVLVTTKIMKRAQLLDASREIIFCDSSSSCDTLETTITILLTATKAGTVPLGILLHQGQSTESYKAAFGFLKKTFPKCFGKSDVSVNTKYNNIMIVYNTKLSRYLLKCPLIF